MFKHKEKLKALNAELSRTKKQLCKAKKDLEVEKLFASYCWDNYANYMSKCEELEREINALKSENKKLELILKAFKAVDEAHKNYNCNRKEA